MYESAAGGVELTDALYPISFDLHIRNEYMNTSGGIYTGTGSA
jgi:hypothetical protein